MQIVIDIPDNEYHQICELRLHNRTFYDDAIRKGTPLNDVLDKIRAEIEQNAYPIVHGVNNHEKGMTLYGILQIIDKYRKEQE